MSNARRSASEDLAEAFFAEARSVSLGEKQKFEFDVQAILQIASDVGLRARFIRLFRQNTQDSETQTIILDYLDGLAEDEDGHASALEIYADGINKYVGRVGYGTTIAGAGALIGVGATMGPISLVGGGLTALIVGGIGSTRLKLSKNAKVRNSQKLRRMADDLRGIAKEER